MKIKCSVCSKSGVFLDSATDKEIEDRGFFVWGRKNDGEIECTCYTCAQDPENHLPVTIKSEISIPEKRREKTIVISGLHLGNPKCNRDAILSIINSEYSKLIVNGDIIDCIHHKELTNWDAVILRCLENYQIQGKAVILRGEEENWCKSFNKYTSLTLTDEYTWDYLGKKYHARNGNEMNGVYGSKTKAIEIAKEKGYRAFFVGNSQKPELEKIDGIFYINTGMFTNPFYSFAVMNGKTDIVRLVDSSLCSGLKNKNHANVSNTSNTSNVSVKCATILPIVDQFEIPKVNNKQFMEF